MDGPLMEDQPFLQQLTKEGLNQFSARLLKYKILLQQNFTSSLSLYIRKV